MPPDQVARVERMVSTFVLGYAISETGGRFGTEPPDDRYLRKLDLPGHHRIGSKLLVPVSADAEFEADMDDLIGLIARLG